MHGSCGPLFDLQLGDVEETRKAELAQAQKLKEAEESAAGALCCAALHCVEQCFAAHTRTHARVRVRTIPIRRAQLGILC